MGVKTSTSIFWDSRISTHAAVDESASARATGASVQAHTLADSSDYGLVGKISPMNHHAKFDAASFILGREIRNGTNTDTHKITNKQ